MVKHVYSPLLTVFAVNADSQRQLTCYIPVKTHLPPLVQSVGSVARRGMNIRYRRKASGHDALRSPEQAHSPRCRNFATNAATSSSSSLRVAGNPPPQPTLSSLDGQPHTVFVNPADNVGSAQHPRRLYAVAPLRTIHYRPCGFSARAKPRLKGGWSATGSPAPATDSCKPLGTLPGKAHLHLRHSRAASYPWSCALGKTPSGQLLQMLTIATRMAAGDASPARPGVPP